MKRTTSERLPAGEAKSAAQMLAFAPFAFFAATTMRDTGLLDALEEGGREPTPTAPLAAATGLSEYAVSVLLDFGTDIGIVTRSADGYTLDALGHILLKDEMTRVNMNFTRDFAHHGLPFLETAIREGRPAGLATLGDWPNLYAGLRELPEPMASSWFRFDQFYSDQAFPEVLEHIFQWPIRHVVDVGGNTGRFALQCLAYDPEVHVTILDLPGPLEMARNRLEEAGYGARIHLQAAELQDPDTSFPEGADAIVMSQLLACFPPAEIDSLLRRVARAMNHDTRLYVVELFPDRQVHDAARFSLNAISLYFTCLVNGNSRFYPRDALVEMIESAGLAIAEETENIGAGHTLLCCRRAD